MIALTVMLTLVTYRLTRFAILDSLFEEPRRAVHGLIIGKRPGAVRAKLYELVTCPMCLSVWFAAAVTALADIWTSVPMPGFVWLATSGGVVIVWRGVEQ